MIKLSRRAPMAALLVASLALAGCDIGDPFVKPQAAAPAAWDAGNAGAGLWPDTTWWRDFGSSELDGLMTAAEAGNRDLSAALARIRQAEASAKIAGAALLPTLGADGGASRS